MLKALLCFLFLTIHTLSDLPAQTKIESQFRIARLKYSGGGDWYNDPQEEVNLLKFVQQNTGIDCDPTYEFIDLSSDKLFSFPFLFMTGHGNINFSEFEVRRLRDYLAKGGFLYADDDYGMDKAFRREMKRSSLIKRWLNCRSVMEFTTASIISRTAFRRYINMTGNLHRDSDCS